MSYSSVSHYRRLGLDEEIKTDEIFDSILSIYGEDKNNYETAELVESGYEDFNSRLWLKRDTGTGDMFVKIFASQRNRANRDRYLEVIRHMQTNGVAVPQLKIQPKGDDNFEIDIAGQKLRGVVMQLIDNGSLMEANYWLTPNEIKRLAYIAASINDLDYHPTFTYDSWAIINAKDKLIEANKHFQTEDLPELVQKTCNRLSTVDLTSLPQAFVHGDMRRSNVLRSSGGTLYITDFSVSNYQPRIVELAVVAHDTLFNPHDLSRFKIDLKLFINAYQEKILLTDAEHQALPLLIQTAAAVDIMGGTVALASGDTTPAFVRESQYWRNLGRSGLAHYASIFGED